MNQRRVRAAAGAAVLRRVSIFLHLKLSFQTKARFEGQNKNKELASFKANVGFCWLHKKSMFPFE